MALVFIMLFRLIFARLTQLLILKVLLRSTRNTVFVNGLSGMEVFGGDT